MGSRMPSWRGAFWLACCRLVLAAREPQVVLHVPPGDLTLWLKQHGPLQPNTSLLLAPGDHALSETLRLGASATGLRVSAGSSGGARLTGGYAVPPNAWHTEGEIWRARLPPGTWSPGSDPPRQLWTGEGRHRRTRARHPNLWNHDVSAIEEQPYLYWSSPLATSFGGAHCSAHSCAHPCINPTACDAAVRENRYGFRYNQSTDGDLMAMLASANDCETQGGDCGGLEAVVYHGWTVSRSFVSFVFPAGHSVHLRNPSDRPIGFWTGLDSEGGQRYYLENAEALLDAPGEFFVKPNEQKDGGGELLYMPVPGETSETVGAILPVLQELIVVDGADHVSFERVEISHSDWSCGGQFKNETCDMQSAQEQEGAAVRIRNANGVHFQQVNITHVGLQALWFEQGVSDGSFTRGTIADLGTGAVRVGPWVARGVAASIRRHAHGNAPEAVHNIHISDSLFTNGGWVFAAGTGFLLQTNTTNVTLEHCELSHFSYTAVSLGWSWNFSPQTTNSHFVTKNYIHHLGYPRRETGDAMACIYTLGQLNDTVVAGNLCHDVRAYRSGGYCLSQDQGSSNVLFDSNVCLRTTASPHNTHYGENLTYQNNIFFGGGWSSKVSDPQLIAGCLRTSPQQGLPDRLRFRSNLIGQVNNASAQLFEGNFNATSSPGNYSFAFASNMYWSELMTPKGDLRTAAVFGGESARVLGKRNGTWRAEQKLTWSQWQAEGQDIESVLLKQGDHPFARDDWDVALKPGLASKIGFTEIDTSTVGMRPAPAF